MPETDVNKMKVADLKRELKIRGLATTGNKTELQDRLQTALIDGELSLDDTAISAEDLDVLDEDVLTDEEDSHILGGDENELLQSPTIKDIAPSLIASKKIVENEPELMSTTTAKKLVLKRKSSITAHIAPVSTTTKVIENTEPSTAKVVKLNERKPITISGGDIKINQNNTSAAAVKVGQLSSKERLELRAKKFGISVTGGTATGSKVVNAEALIVDEKKIEILKKRAERFGCIVSKEISNIDAEEKKLKRKQRFGGDAEKTGEWSDKARMRLERFKTVSNAATKIGETAIGVTKAED